MNKYFKYTLLISTGSFVGFQLLSFLKKKKKEEDIVVENTTIETPESKSLNQNINPIITKISKQEANSVTEKREEYYEGFLIQTGARGGKYYINGKGKKVYLKQLK